MINMREETIRIYNSSKVGEPQANQDLRHLLYYLQDEHTQKKGSSAPPLSDQWQLFENQRAITPIQINSTFYILFLVDLIASLL